MAITYSPNIPQATDQISQSQPQILENFQGINTLLAVDHATFASSNAGFHNKTTFPVQGSAPSFTAGNIGLYNLLDSVSTVNQLFINLQDGTNVPITAAAKAANPGYTYLPSGLLVKWGTGTANGSTVITYPTGATIPVFNNVYHAQVITVRGSVATNTLTVLQAYSTTTITVIGVQQTSTTATTASCAYIVIGD